MKKQTYTEAKNWNVRYTIRYENGTAILYRDEKKIVKKEDWNWMTAVLIGVIGEKFFLFGGGWRGGLGPYGTLPCLFTIRATLINSPIYGYDY